MRTVIVDDDGLVAISLKTILEAQGIEVAATGNDGKEAIELYHQYHPDVLLMDIQMKEMSGLEAAEQILIEDAEAKILFLTTFSDDEYIVKALNIGAKGYILKQDFEGIAPAMQAVERGQSVFGGEIVHKIPVLMQSKEEFDYEKYDISEKEQPKHYALTDVLLETLSIIAYKQPITRAEIEKIRGVSCSHAVSRLVDYNLVCELGRLDAPGRPLLFGTTEEFLRTFGVSSIEELPILNQDQLENFKREAEEEMQMKMDI